MTTKSETTRRVIRQIATILSDNECLGADWQQDALRIAKFVSSLHCQSFETCEQAGDQFDASQHEGTSDDWADAADGLASGPAVAPAPEFSVQEQLTHLYHQHGLAYELRSCHFAMSDATGADNATREMERIAAKIAVLSDKL